MGNNISCRFINDRKALLFPFDSESNSEKYDQGEILLQFQETY